MKTQYKYIFAFNTIAAAQDAIKQLDSGEMVMPDAQEIAFYSFRFGEDTTAIENVDVDKENDVIFDLAGRRVSEITSPGIYIVNGKKVLVK